MNNYNLNVNSLRPILIGYEGEYNVQTVTIDYSDWVEEFGSGSLTLRLQRYGDENPYDILLEGSNGVAVWTVSRTDASVEGTGSYQLIYTTATGRKESDVEKFRVAYSLDSDTQDVPDPYVTWLDQVQDIGAEVQFAVEHYPKIEDGYWYVWDVANEEWVNTDQKTEGEDGHSPVITATKSNGVTTIFVDDEPIATINDGHTPEITTTKSGKTTTILADGEPVGTVLDGVDGTDGNSPVITTSKSGKTTTILSDGVSIGTVLDGVDGLDGAGVPSGGTRGQILVKSSSEDYDTEWQSQSDVTLTVEDGIAIIRY